MCDSCSRKEAEFDYFESQDPSHWIDARGFHFEGLVHNKGNFTDEVFTVMYNFNKI